MMTAIQPYIDLILKERSWSWALVCLLYILAALFVRGWFIGPLSIQMKMIEKKHLHQLKSRYLRQSVLGWLLFLLPLALIALYWQKKALPISIHEPWLVGIGFLSFILSVIFHLQAFGVSALLLVETLEGQKPGEV